MIFSQTIIFLTNPISLLGFAFLVSWIILQALRDDTYEPFIQIVFLIVSLFIWLSRNPLSRFDIVAYALFSFFITSTIVINAKKKALEIILLIFAVSLIVTAFISYILFGALNEVSSQASITLLFLKIPIPLFYYYIFPISIASFFLGYCWIYCLDWLFQEIREKKLSKVPISRALFLYFQFLPLCLLPIFLAQALGRTDLLGNLIFYLNNLCVSYILLFGYSLFLALLGDKLLKTKIYFIGGSIISLLSASITFYLAFQYIVWKVNNGSWALAFTLIPLISYILGTIAKRVNMDSN